MSEKLRRRLEKGPIPAVYGSQGWRVCRYPAGVTKADVEAAIVAGEAEWHFSGLRLKGGSHD